MLIGGLCCSLWSKKKKPSSVKSACRRQVDLYARISDETRQCRSAGGLRTTLAAVRNNRNASPWKWRKNDRRPVAPLGIFGRERKIIQPNVRRGGGRRRTVSLTHARAHIHTRVSHTLTMNRWRHQGPVSQWHCRTVPVPFGRENIRSPWRPTLHRAPPLFREKKVPPTRFTHAPKALRVPYVHVAHCGRRAFCCYDNIICAQTSYFYCPDRGAGLCAAVFSAGPRGPSFLRFLANSYIFRLEERSDRVTRK